MYAHMDMPVHHGMVAVSVAILHACVTSVAALQGRSHQVATKWLSKAVCHTTLFLKVLGVSYSCNCGEGGVEGGRLMHDDGELTPPCS